MGALSALLLQAKLAWDGSEAEKGMGSAGDGAEKLESRMGKALKNIGTAIAAAFTVDKIINFSKECINAGAEVSAETAAFTQIMGDYADEASKKLSGIADTTGMVDSRLTPYMTSMTAKFKGLGYGVDDATSMAARGLTMAADASAFWDMSLDESTSHLNSFINGSYEGGEAIGLFANDTQMAAYAIEQGLVKDTAAWSKLDEATKQATRLEYAENMMKQSGATGQAAKESGAYANVMANLTEKWRQFQATIGEPLIEHVVVPAVNLLSAGIDKLSIGVQYVKDHFNEWMEAAKGLVPWIEAAIITYGGLKVGTAIQGIVTGFQNAKLAVTLFTQSQGAANIATGIATGALKLQEVAVGLLTGKIKLSQVATALWSKAQAALNIVLNANPIGLVVAAIAALVAGFVVAYQKSETFRNFVNGLWDSLKNLLQPAIEAVGNFLTGTLGPAFQSVGSWITGTVVPALSSLWDWLSGNILSAIQSVADWITGTLVPTLQSWGSYITGTIVPALAELGAAISDRLTPIFQAIADFVASTVVPAFQNISNFITGSVVPAFQTIVTTVQETLTAAAPILEAIKAYFTMVWENIKTVLSTVWDNIKVVVSTGLETIKGVITAVTALIEGDWSGAWEAIKGVASTIWEGIKAIVGNSIEAAKTVLSNTLEGIKGIWSSAWDTVKNVGSTIWEGIKSTASTLWEGIKTLITNQIETVKTTASNNWNTMKSTASTVWNGIKSTAGTVWNGIKTGIANQITSVKTTASNNWNTMKSAASTAWNGIKSTASTLWSGIKTGIANQITSVKTTASNNWNTMKSAASTAWNSIKSTASTVWEGVKSTITDKIEGAKETVSKVIDAIKGFFDFEFKWPNIPMPHFSISPSGWSVGDLLHGSIPKLSVSWYAKAMDEAAVLDGATIFGAAGGQLLGGGEAGREVVSGEAHLIGLINNAVAQSNEAMLAVLREILEAIRAINEDLYDTIVDAMTDGVRFKINEREFGRLVRAHA